MLDDALLQAEGKPWQLAVAARMGLELKKTQE